MLPAHIINALNGSIVMGNAFVESIKTDTIIQAHIRAIQDKNKLDLSINHAIKLHNDTVSAVNAIDDVNYSFEYHSCGINEVLTIET